MIEKCFSHANLSMFFFITMHLMNKYWICWASNIEEIKADCNKRGNCWATIFFTVKIVPPFASTIDNTNKTHGFHFSLLTTWNLWHEFSTWCTWNATLYSFFCLTLSLKQPTLESYIANQSAIKTEDTLFADKLLGKKVSAYWSI